MTLRFFVTFYLCAYKEKTSKMGFVTVLESAIKGNHVFKIYPHNEIEMIVEKDTSNLNDKNVMVVKMRN